MPDFRADDTPMLEFLVEGMASTRIAGAVSRAVRALDRHAQVTADPVTQRLEVQPGSADAEDIMDMLRVAGFTATLVASGSEPVSPVSVLVDFNPTPVGNFAEDRFADATGSINLPPPLFLGRLEP